MTGDIGSGEAPSGLEGDAGTPQGSSGAAKSGWPWARLIAMLALVSIAVVLLEAVYAQYPIPPGVDPGDWITRGGAYVGLSVPPPASFGSSFIYPPLVFPMLGGLLWLFGSPVSAGFVAGGLFLFLFGLSLIYLAFRFLRFGPLQVGFVGACIFSGTLLYMLFWGAYPNFFAFVFLNLLFVFLFLYVRSGHPSDGLLLGVALSLLYLVHSLTFAIGIATVLTAAVLVTIMDGPRFLWTRIKNRGLLAGAIILVATVGSYAFTLRAEGITAPNYLGANPAALSLDNVGQLFAPLANGPAFLPAGPALYMSPTVAMVLLAGVSGVLILALVFVRRLRPDWVDCRFTVAVGGVVAALLTPVGGTLAQVGTDYPRFVYFLPVPATLLVTLTLDKAVERWSHAPKQETVDPAGRDPAWEVSPGRAATASGYVAMAVVLTLLFANVSVPSALQGEKLDTGTTHSAQFLSAAEWLAQNPVPGSVLTLQGTARWIQALTDRGTYDIGPTWLDFEPWQIINSQTAFWALNSRFAVTDGSAILSYTPTNTTLLNQAPMYSVFVDGVVFPVVRILPGALSVTVTTPTGMQTVRGSNWGPGVLTINSTTGTGTIAYSTPWFEATVEGTLGSAGATSMNFTVAANAGNTLAQVNLSMGGPPAGIALLHTPSSQSVTLSSSGFNWTSTGTLAQLPSPETITTTGTYSPAPSAMVLSAFPANVTLTSVFAIPSADSRFSVSLALSTPGTGNPGITLPLVLDTEAFLQSHDIHFLVLSSGGPYAPTIAFYQTVFGFTTVYANSGWEVLEG